MNLHRNNVSKKIFVGDRSEYQYIPPQWPLYLVLQ